MNSDSKRGMAEVACVERLLASLQLQYAEISKSDPPRPDVIALLHDGRRLGVEVTEVHARGHVASETRGKSLQAIEKHKLREAQGGSYALWQGAPEPVDAIAHRIREKNSKTYAVEDGEELWLLLVANMAEHGKAATFLLPDFVSVEQLNKEMVAAPTMFARIYLQFQLPAGLFEWTHPAGWKVLQRPVMFHDANPILGILRGASNRLRNNVP